MMKKYEGKRYYRIRATVFWPTVGLFILLLLGVYFKDELYEKWLRSGGMEDVTFEGLTSALENKGSCYLCGVVITVWWTCSVNPAGSGLSR